MIFIWNVIQFLFVLNTSFLFTVTQPTKQTIANDLWKNQMDHFDSKVTRHKRAATAHLEQLWDFGVVPYKIDSIFGGEHRALFKQAMRQWEKSTCLKFVERNKGEHDDYIVFTKRQDCECCSSVGKQGNGSQAISIGKNCDKLGIVLHEIGHAIGFSHEHNRPDRDENVQVFNENIMDDQLHNFIKFSKQEVNSLGFPYDYSSIMHYSKGTFAKKPNLNTMDFRDSAMAKGFLEMGQRRQLSNGDIAQTNSLYRCPICGQTIQNASGTIVLHNYLLPSENVIFCQWYISATHGERIVLNITDIDITETDYCVRAFIEVRDGYWAKSPLLGRFCGQGQMTSPIVSSAHQMLITYYDSSKQHSHRGFNATYEVVCGGQIITEKGFLQSPNYPDDYPLNKTCLWQIIVPVNYQVALHFESFDVENHKNCSYDFLEVRDGPFASSNLIGKFCGNRVLGDILSSYNQLFVKFVSDESASKSGFSASFVKEVNECSRGDHECQHFCVNTMGSYRCECDIGFELQSDGKRCVTSCGGILEAPSGIIRSPSFPLLYPPNKNCIWQIVAPQDYRITLNFTFFDLEGNNQDCEFDKLDISSVVGQNNEKHGVFCGSKTPPVITSIDNNLVLHFTSDSSTQRKGFSLHYSTDKDKCALNNGGCEHWCRNANGSHVCECRDGFVLNPNQHNCVKGTCSFQISNSVGQVTSPDYPNDYPNKMNCAWYFIATPGHRIKVTFTDFDLEVQHECTNDYIAIFDGPTINSSSLGRFCGHQLLPPITTSQNKAVMIFKSDASVQRSGFKILHSTMCGGRLVASSTANHLFSHAKYGDANYEPKENCDWQIVAKDSQRIYLKFVTFELEHSSDCSYDFVQLFDGFDDTSSQLGKFCGSLMPNETISSGDSLLLRFQTDESVNSKGFTLIYYAID